MQKLWLKLINKGFIALKTKKSYQNTNFLPDIRPKDKITKAVLIIFELHLNHV